jgi:hypothetical protein
MENFDTNARLRAQVAELSDRLDDAELKIETLLFVLAGLHEQKLIDVDLRTGQLRWPDRQ